METKKKLPRLHSAWLYLGAVTIPLALIVLFEILKNSQSLMTGWVFGIMAPVEQFLGRLWSIFPFSVAEVLTALFLIGCVVWLVRMIVLAFRTRALALFFSAG